LSVFMTSIATVAALSICGSNVNCFTNSQT
jgi:hypothetical protein